MRWCSSNAFICFSRSQATRLCGLRIRGKDEYALLKEALRTYPGDVRLLLELLSCGECLIADGDTVNGAERNTIDKDKNYHVDPITSPYIVEAFTMYDEGRTMKEIVAVLNQHGLKNQRGGELNLNSVSRLLQNRFYIGEYKYREVLVPDGIPAIIPKDLFDRVQEKLAKNKKAPARHKAEDDYLLTTKLFCGDCQSLMFGESGTSQSGATYHYYKCSSAKKKTGCNRKPVKKKWIEDAVLDQVKTVLHDDVFIGDVVHKYLEYQQQENTVIPYLEKNLSDTQRSIDNLIVAIEQGIITPSTKQRLETLEISKRELEDKILIENMKRPLRTEDELWAWFRYMRNFDLTRLEERRQLIDVFVNTVFLYNDRFLLTLNFGYGSKTVLFTDIPCSDKVACGRPKISRKRAFLDLFSANFYIFSTKLAISVDHMFACFFGFYWIISYLFLDPFENPFSLLSATQILRADRLISVSSFAFTSP